jgi:hypothetical protein
MDTKELLTEINQQQRRHTTYTHKGHSKYEAPPEHDQGVLLYISYISCMSSPNKGAQGNTDENIGS